MRQYYDELAKLSLQGFPLKQNHHQLNPIIIRLTRSKKNQYVNR